MTCTERKRMNSPHQPVGRWIRVEKRIAIYLRDHFRCMLCDCDLHGVDASTVTLDHLIPRSENGSNEASNLYTCCRTCNCTRKDEPLENVATPAAMRAIERNSEVELAPFVKLAKQILKGELDYSRDM